MKSLGRLDVSPSLTNQKLTYSGNVLLLKPRTLAKVKRARTKTFPDITAKLKL